MRLFAALTLLFAASLPLHAGDDPIRATDVRPLLPGTSLPDVKVERPDGTRVSLAALTAGQPSILVFYRGGWCPYCTLQLSQLAEIEPDLVALGYRVLALSPDRPEILAEGADDTPDTRILLSDSSAAAARAFGIAFRVDTETLELYRGYGIDLEEASGEDHHLLPVPAVFLADASGTIQFAYVHPDYRYRVPGELVLAAARTLRDPKPLR